MKLCELPNWPPTWSPIQLKGQPATGEIGVLEQVLMQDKSAPKCYLIIRHNNSKYLGSLTFDDPPFADKSIDL
jgi:hypothetical protein